MCSATERLFATIRVRLAGDPAGQRSLEAFERDQTAGSDALCTAVADALASDPRFLEDVAGQLAGIKQAGSHLNVVVEAEHVVGIRARRMGKGRADVAQKAQRAKDLTGTEHDDIG